MKVIDEKYELWYQVWNENYIPLIMDRQKWHFRKENLTPGDIVYFKLKESKMSATWRIGKVEEVTIGKDGFVREILIAYKDISGNDSTDWTHRTVSRPVRNVVKLFHVNDTTLMDDIQLVHKLSEEILSKDRISFEPNVNFRLISSSNFEHSSNVIVTNCALKTSFIEEEEVQQVILSAAPFIHNLMSSFEAIDVKKNLKFTSDDENCLEGERDEILCEFNDHYDVFDPSFEVYML